MRWHSPKQKEIHESKLRMPLLGKDMMITGKIIEKAEEEEEDSDLERQSEENEEDDVDFDQYKDIEEDFIEIKKLQPSPYLSTSLREKGIKKRTV